MQQQQQRGGRAWVVSAEGQWSTSKAAVVAVLV
jgi:hypothetical protein